ncbi:MAG: lactate dehydrogenase [Firmicutes bacterium]|nr:lactate dehydrogenase [Bacillota bacterium]
MRRLHELYQGDIIRRDHSFIVPGYRLLSGRKHRIHILAMGDVGGTLALAIRLVGSDVVSEIGICDINEKSISRWEQELNQITMPDDPSAFPEVVPVQVKDLFQCDAVVFCASAGVPDLSRKDVDVRMVQLEKNRELIDGYAAAAVRAGYEGEFFVVSDPVDPLCRAALQGGIGSKRIQGFGLGVMNARAAYYARRDPAFASYLTGGRVFGPHGKDLVVADDINHYDDAKSKRLTEMTVQANVMIRETGFKPYIAPAVSSGALSILENLRGHWQYSSAWFGGEDGTFLGMRNRRTEEGLEIEDLPLDDRLFDRIERAFIHLKKLR